MQISRRIALSFAVVLAASAPLAAQDAAVAATSTETAAPAVEVMQQPAAQTSVAPAVALGPMNQNLHVGVSAYAPAAPAPFALPPREHMRTSVVMMIVGGAILVTGAVIGGQAGTIVMIGGGVVGIIGLIRYLQ